MSKVGKAKWICWGECMFRIIQKTHVQQVLKEKKKGAAKRA